MGKGIAEPTCRIWGILFRPERMQAESKGGGRGGRGRLGTRCPAEEWGLRGEREPMTISE